MFYKGDVADAKIADIPDANSGLNNNAVLVVSPASIVFPTNLYLTSWTYMTTANITMVINKIADIVHVGTIIICFFFSCDEFIIYLFIIK